MSISKKPTRKAVTELLPINELFSKPSMHKLMELSGIHTSARTVCTRINELILSEEIQEVLVTNNKTAEKFYVYKPVEGTKPKACQYNKDKVKIYTGTTLSPSAFKILHGKLV